MPFLPARSTLAAATISGAAVRADAVGGDPARITTAPDILREHGGVYNGVVFDVDGVHYWTSDFATPNTVVRRLLSTGAVDLTVTITGAGPMGMQRWYDSGGVAYLLVAGWSSKKIYEIRMSDGAVIRTSPTMAHNPAALCKLPGATDLIWIVDTYNTAVAREYNIATGVATGRTFGSSLVGTIGSSVAGEIFVATQRIIYRVNVAAGVSPPVALETWDLTNPTLTLMDGAPGTSTAASIQAYQSTLIKRIWVDATNANVYSQRGDGSVDVLNRATGLWARASWADPDRDGVSLQPADGYSWANWMDLSPDGKWRAQNEIEGATTQSAKWIRLARIDDAVAVWTFPILSGGEVTVDTFAVPGDLGNSTGRPSARSRSERATMRWDDRRTILYYSIDGGTSWVAFGNGERLAVTCPAGVSPMLRAVLKPPSWGRPAAPRPWIAAADGVAGPSLWYEDLSANVYVPVQTATVRGALLQQPMLRGRMAP